MKYFIFPKIGQYAYIIFFLNISKKMLETKYTMNFGQLFKIAHNLNKYTLRKIMSFAICPMQLKMSFRTSLSC
jgi:hypothetical protein